MASLRHRLIQLQLILLIMFLGMMLYSTSEIRRVEASNTQADALRLAQLIKGEQKQFFTETRQLLPLLAFQIDQLRKVPSFQAIGSCSGYFAQLLKDYPQYANLGLINPDGTVQCSGLPFKESTRLDDRDYFVEAKETGLMAVGNYQIGRITGKASINVGYPLLDTEKAMKGVIFAALDLEKLGQSLKGLDLPEGTTVTLLSDSGIVLSRFPNAENLIGRSALEWPIFQTMMNLKSEGTTEVVDYRGIKRLYAFTPIIINGKSIYVSVGIPSHLAYANVNTLYLRTVIFFIVIAVIFCSLIWSWVGSTVMKPLKLLKKASEKLQKGDLTARTQSISSTDEITHLAQTFNSMAETLESRYQESAENEKKLNNLNQALRTLSSGNSALIRGTEEPILLEEMCYAAVKEGGYAAAWVGYLDEKSKRIQPMASAGIDKNLLPSLPDIFEEKKGSFYPSMAAIQSLEPCLVSGSQVDDYKMINSFFSSHTVRGILALPLIVEGTAIGVFTIYTENDEAFNSEACAILKEMTEDLAYGIKTLRLRKKHAEAQQTIHQLAYFDELTKLPNHVQLEEILEKSFGADSQEPKAAILIIGLDRFRDINATLGFAAGNRVLCETGKWITQGLLKDETLFRMRGDEFALLIPEADANIAKSRALQVLELLEPLHSLDGFSLSVKASIGIVLISDHCEELDKLLPHADVALQYAKQTGNGYEFYKPDQDTDKEYYLALAGKLNRAILNEELELYYQPKISMTTGKVCGFEALSRWFPSGEKMVSPNVFIGLAEKTGMIRPLSHWVIDRALRQSYLWRQIGISMPIAINLSARNLHDPQLLSFIVDRATAWEFEKEMLEIEITESSIMEDLQAAIEVLSSIKDFGIPLYIDDFGTGQSSLVALRKLPVSALKIDKNFVIDMLDDKDAAAIVRTTIALAEELNFKVVAEGVENKKVWQTLVSLNCHYGQGFYMGKPMPAEDVEVWLQTSEFGLNAKPD